MSRSRSLHQSTGSHLSSDSQTTVVCNYDISTPPLGADAGGNTTSPEVISQRAASVEMLKQQLRVTAGFFTESTALFVFDTVKSKQS